MPPSSFTPAPLAFIPSGFRDRPPLPPGHPLSWALINRGTVLERSAYPFPVFNCDPPEGTPR